ncbi:hypothetical protein DQ04_00191010 [Trypanosoma grayi]|uniref:hypothetical protein n=1 Tax=Trypanosoma grayi TaxID=71804 RepID=UPI0004F47BCF|nr:hypothetical protein DQ04_00191010 [Trypanosoma grayi]KEG15077.1 hypothetical protein DQ04_00191010 [Trypanosoma grayi]
MPSVEDLQRAICAERERHQQVMESMERQRDTLQSLLDDQKQAFQDLISRVTRLRVAKGEYLAAETDGTLKEVKFDTGCEAVDNLLYDIQDGVKEAVLTDGILLTKLSTAATQAVTPSSARRPSTPSVPCPSTRSTSIAVVLRNEIRATQPWAQKHYKKCGACDAKRARLQPWEQIDEKAVGLAALPDLRHIPGKSFYKGSLRFLRERSGDRTLHVLRVSLVMQVKAANGGRIVDPAATAVQMTQVFTKWIANELTNAKEVARKAPWNEKATENLMLSGAVEMLLHSLDARVCVTAAPPTAVRTAAAACTPLSVDVAITTPTHVPTITPFIALLAEAEQRAYIVKYIVHPIAERIGKLVGMPETVSKYTTTAFNALDALYRMAQREGVVEEPRKKSPKRAKPTLLDTTFQKVRAILLALAVFDTTVEIDCACPRLDDVKDVSSAKKSVLSLARSFLRWLTAPVPYTMPAVDDPKCANLVVRVLRAPTLFLEILNSAFSSNRRLPSASRVGVVDYLASPKSKIRYGLKFFSELVVDVYRPYAPNTGVIIAEEKGKSGKPKASRCTPVTDLPRDIVRANVEVAVQAKEIMQKLHALQQQAADETDVERRGKEVVHRVLEEVHDDALCAALVKDLEGLQIEVDELTSVCVDVWLPFGFDFAETVDSSGELLYLRVQGLRQS